MKNLVTAVFSAALLVGCNSNQTDDGVAGENNFKNIQAGFTFEYQYENTSAQPGGSNILFVSDGTLSLRIDSISEDEKNLWATGNLIYTTKKKLSNDSLFDSTVSSTSSTIYARASILDSDSVQETIDISGCCFSRNHSLFPDYIRYKESQKSEFTMNYKEKSFPLFQEPGNRGSSHYDSTFNIAAFSEYVDIRALTSGKLILMKINSDSVSIITN